MSEWDNWYGSHDWDAMNDCLRNSQGDSSYHRPDPKPVRSSLAGRMPNYFDKIMKQQEPTRQSAQKCLPRDIEVIEASRSWGSTERKNDTMVERLILRVNNNYVTVARYDGDNNNCIVDVNGNARSTSMDAVEGIIEDL